MNQTLDRQQAFSGTMPVREAHRFDLAALERFMAEHVEGFRGPLEVEQFRGGQSNPTYLVTTPGRNYVLRRKPPGQLLKSAHAVDREYRVITALGQTGFPVPRTHALCTDESVIGTWFFVMEHVEGRIFWEPTAAALDKAERAALYDSMNRTIARLHGVDYAALGLSDYGKPGNYFARQISRWVKQYRASETQDIPAMNRLIEWLPENIPQSDETTIVHGDFRLDNMIVHPSEPRVIAVLDWELSTLGHPLSDFSYHCMLYRMPPELFNGLKGLDLGACAIPREADYVASYCARTGRDGIDHWDYYMAFNMFRIAAILQGIMGRVVARTAASRHAREMGARAKPLAEAAWAQVERMG
ncbi:MAG: phosphotransferase [Sphingomonadales bacterium]